METEEMIFDMRKTTADERAEGMRQSDLLFKLNHTMPRTEEYTRVLKELFGENIGENTFVAAPLNGAALHRLKIGSGVFINGNLLAMARGGIKIEDNVQIAGNVSLLSNNHDLYDRMILTCKPILIKKGAWIGANVCVLPGVTIGKYAVVGAGSVVTNDIPDYSVAVGNPARVIQTLDESRFEE